MKCIHQTQMAHSVPSTKFTGFEPREVRGPSVVKGPTDGRSEKVPENFSATTLARVAHGEAAKTRDHLPAIGPVTPESSSSIPLLSYPLDRLDHEWHVTLYGRLRREQPGRAKHGSRRPAGRRQALPKWGWWPACASW